MSPTDVVKRAAAAIGPIELCATAGMIIILSQVTWPQLLQVRTRAEQAVAIDALNKVATAARAHFIEHGTYACGPCDLPAATTAHYTFNLGAQATTVGHRCLQLPAAAAQQGADRFVATAVRLFGSADCEIWKVTAERGIVRQVVQLPQGAGGYTP